MYSKVSIVFVFAGLTSGCAGSSSGSTNVVDIISRSVKEQMGLNYDGVFPQEQGRLLDVGWVVQDDEVLSALWEYCPEADAVDMDALVRSGRVANLKVARIEKARWGIDVGAKASEFGAFFPDLETSLKRGEEMSMTIRFKEGTLVRMDDARTMRLLGDLSSCPALKAKAPFKYISELLIAKVSFTFEGTKSTKGRIRLGWTKPAGAAGDALDEASVDIDELDTLAEAADELPDGAPREARVGVNAEGSWMITEGGVVESVGPMVFAIRKSKGLSQ